MKEEAFREEIAQLASSDVAGCAPDAASAAQAKLDGAAHFKAGEYAAAAKKFSEALQDTDEASAEGARLAARCVNPYRNIDT